MDLQVNFMVIFPVFYATLQLVELLHILRGIPGLQNTVWRGR